MLRLRVRLFAAHREAAGRSAVEVSLEPGATVGDLKGAVLAKVPRLRAVEGATVVAVNGEFVGDGARLSEGDEVALFPPVAGG